MGTINSIDELIRGLRDDNSRAKRKIQQNDIQIAMLEELKGYRKKERAIAKEKNNGTES